MKFPKIICRCIWNERNQRIFQNKTQPEWKIAAKAIALHGEVVSNSNIPSNNENLTEIEKVWMQSLNIPAVSPKEGKKLED